jgi:hypothetical protein
MEFYTNSLDSISKINCFEPPEKSGTVLETPVSEANGEGILTLDLELGTNVE